MFEIIQKNKKNGNENLYRKELLFQLDNLQSNNPKQYWELVEKLKNENNRSKESSIDMKQWREHFENLNKLDSKQNDTNLTYKLKEAEKQAIFNELDYKITTTEVLAAIKTLKNGKACGFSNIYLMKC